MTYFNFNNEEYLLPITLADDQSVTVNVDGQSLNFDSIQDLAESYAIARNVSGENLKNWTLIQDGDTYSFVLRAATAGLDEEEYEDEKEEEDDNDENEEEYEDEEEENEELRLFGQELNDDERRLAVIYYQEQTDPLVENLYTYYANPEHVNAFFAFIQHLKAWHTPSLLFSYHLEGIKSHIEQGYRPDEEEATEKANRQLKLAALAHRETFQIYEVTTSQRRCQVRHVETNETLEGPIFFVDHHYVNLPEAKDLPTPPKEEVEEDTDN